MHRYTIAFVLLLSINPFYFPAPISNILATSANENIWNGPYVDEIYYEIISEEEDEVQALINGQIDLIGNNIDTTYINQLNSTDEIEVTKYLENGYTFLTLNCAKYPLNISSFRRALAFAINKTKIVNDSFSGLAQPLDVVVPSQNPFSIEHDLNTSYYESNTTIAMDLLISAGFYDTDEDGWLEGPGPLGPGTIELDHITIEGYSSIQNNILMNVIVESLTEIGILAYAIHTSNPDELRYRTSNHLDYDIILLDQVFPDFKIDWLASEFGSDYVNTTGDNIANFMNSTFDNYIPNIISSIDINDIQYASQQIQEILALEFPYIPCYQKYIFSAIRTDRFENYINDKLLGLGGWWTNYKIHLKKSEDGPIGGTLVRSLSSDLDSLNFMTSLSKSTLAILSNLYDTLLVQAPNGEIIPWLAESYSIKTHDELPSIREGNSRYTFQLVQNAIWSDSHPISAYDVAFSINYMRDSGFYPGSFSSLYAAYAKNDYTLVVEFLNESYWYIYDFIDLKIIPKHVFINFHDLHSWNPNLDDPSDPIFVTNGPFILFSYSKGESIILRKNLQYYRLPISNGEYNLSNRKGSISDQTEGRNIKWKQYTKSFSSDLDAEITWTSNDKSYPNLVMNSSYLHGDHVTINATWTNTYVTNATLDFYSYSKKSQPLIIPDSSYNPFIGVIDTTQFSWIIIDNIKADERVEIIADFSNPDCDFMAWWADTDNGTWEYKNNLLSSSMITNSKPENGSFIASRDGELAIGCFNYNKTAGTWTVTVTSGSRHVFGPYENNTVFIDTYNLVDDGTWRIHFTGKYNVTTLSMILNNVTISNSFQPVVEVLNPNGGAISGVYNITWNSTDVNVDDKLTHEIRVSNDGGTSFMLLAAHLNDSSLFWNLTGWIRLNTYIIRVISSDGVLKGTDESDSNVTAGDLSIKDFTVPILSGLRELIHEYSNESIILSWFVSDFHSSNYSILLNGSIYKVGFWNSGNLTIRFENYSVCTYNFTIIVTDSSLNSISLSTLLIIVNATSTTTTTTTSTTTTSYNITLTTTLNGLLLVTYAIIIVSTMFVIISLIYYQKRIHLRTE